MAQSKKILLVITICLLVSTFNAVNAQTAVSPREPKWVSAKGFWVVETSGIDQKTHVIHFYNNDNQLVYKESLSGVRLKTSRRAVKMKLKKVLENSVAGWELKKEQTENLALVARAFK